MQGLIWQDGVRGLRAVHENVYANFIRIRIREDQPNDRGTEHDSG